MLNKTKDSLTVGNSINLFQSLVPQPLKYSPGLLSFSILVLPRVQYFQCINLPNVERELRTACIEIDHLLSWFRLWFGVVFRKPQHLFSVACGIQEREEERYFTPLAHQFQYK